MSLYSCKEFLVVFLFVSFNRYSVFCSRVTTNSAESAGGSNSQSSSSSGSSSGTSLIPTHRERDRDRDLISAQFRAIPEGRDLDTSESSLAGIDALTAAAVGLEDDHLAMSKYMAASASAYSPSKLRVNKYTQTGFYDPYPTYAGAYNSVPSSYYPYNGYGYRDVNPMLDTYPYYERDRIRDIRDRAMHASQSAPYAASTSTGSSNRDGYGSSVKNIFGGYREGYRSNDYVHDSQAMSSGHNNHDDHGHGWGPPKEYTSKVNTNAIGLLGLIGLLSLLSNVLMQFTTTTTTTTTAAMIRIKKRAIYSNDEHNLETKEQRMERIFMEILPFLTPVAHVRDGVLPLECTFHGVCMTNKVLVSELGAHGRPAGIRISSAIVKLLDKIDMKRSFKDGGAYVKKRFLNYSGKNDLKKTLEQAGLHGRNKKDCERTYPVCSALRGKGAPTLPFLIRMQDLPHLISKVSKLSHGGGGVPMNL